ncbi:twin-arginine translocase subunit TatC [Limnovirga soli]|jgi:sec-independent protein translocase protein TatC|uniref:Sec-independent protein translocase protein TatC n=1 Tax=Limnovirga soli TaxID=2656915 RepID=A0A8J8FFM8_9BACT|nr:twin-arginine translocase subunit TatC [Limnovirga soli]NNV57236.1 twin-arginine translocase subunit TatC [Limnovirga soli]
MASGFLERRSSGKAEMSFVDHLEELRWHIVRSVIVILVLAVYIFIEREWVFDNIIAGPINPNFVSYTALCDFSHWLGIGNTLCLPPISVTMQTTTFGGQFFSAFSIAFVGAFIAAFPYIFWEFWRFVKPALKPNEVKGTRFVIFWVSLFFFMGAAFGYFILGPFTFNFLSNFNISSLNILQTKPTLSDYLDNLTNLILGCGITFEMPVMSYALTKMGIITPNFLRRTRKYAIVVNLVLAAIITPSPDWISQTIVFIPLFLLYELAILVSARVYKEQEKKDNEEWS